MPKLKKQIEIIKVGDKCPKCGFQFAGPGEFRNADAFILDGESGIVCGQCGQAYIVK